MAEWRLARSLNVLRAQLNNRYPNRRKDEDGTIGDAAHSSRKSDHNPDENGIVRAMDVTNDTDSGPHGRNLAEALRATRDKRIGYVIFNRQIFAGYETRHRAAWEWGPYDGPNAHKGHVHISVHADVDSAAYWDV